MKRILSLILTVSIIASAFVIPAFASNDAESLIDYIYFDDFSSNDKLTNYYTGTYKLSDDASGVQIYNQEAGSFTDASTYSLTEDGTFKITVPAAKNKVAFYNGFKTSKVDGETPKMVFSYRIKPTLGSATRDYYFGTIHSGGASRGTNAVMFQSSGKIITDKYTSTEVATYTSGEWCTVTIIYDNDSSKVDNRDIYINGEYKGTYAYTGTSSYNYAQKGYIHFAPALCSSTGMSVELDDIMVYTYPEELKYGLTKATSNEVVLNFNMIPDASSLVPSNFTVTDGAYEINPSSVSKSPDNSRQITLTFTENFKPYVNYSVKATGVTAGSSETDVADMLTTSENSGCDFSVGAGNVEWTFTNEFSSFDYEDFDTSLQINDTTEGVYRDSLGLQKIKNSAAYAIEKVDGNTVLTMEQVEAAGDSYLWYMSSRRNFESNSPAYAVETKIKLDFSKNPEDTFLDVYSKKGENGPDFISIYNGNIYSDGNLNDDTQVLASYKDGEWVTLKNVYYSTPVKLNEIEYLRRDIYINGQFATTVYDDWATYGKYVTGNVNFNLPLRIRTRYTSDTNTLVTEGKIFVDYIRFYPVSDNFASRLELKENVGANKINVEFNNIPVEADLFDKIYIADENGTKVSDIVVPEYINDFNASGYASKINLWFKDKLEYGKTYKLCIKGLTDISGNVLYQEETFAVKSVAEVENLVINSDATASVTVNEYSEPLTLVIASYSVDNGITQLVDIIEMPVTAVGTYTTSVIECSDVVKAFLLKGNKPVLSAVSESVE